MTVSETHRAIHAVFRIESPRLIARLTRLVQDLGSAEELAQDALVAALESWPATGVPDKPGAWLMATAKHRAIDELRRHRRFERKQRELSHELEARVEAAPPGWDMELDDPFSDDLLRLVFSACHPALATEARVALTLRLFGGLSTEEIARLLDPRGDGRPAHRAGQAHAARTPHPVRGPARSGSRGALVFGARSHLPHLQRGLLCHRRR